MGKHCPLFNNHLDMVVQSQTPLGWIEIPVDFFKDLRNPQDSFVTCDHSCFESNPDKLPAGTQVGVLLKSISLAWKSYVSDKKKYV